jgi:hypothetical protein
MTERMMPGFTIPLGFYDGPEVRSIPRRIRAAAIGVWALAGNYSATRLSDGYVDAETLKDLGCGPAIRRALMNTLGQGGEPDPLWIEAPAGGIQFTKWDKWQRSRAEVTAYREAEAERKRIARAAKKANRNQGTTEVLPDHYPTATAQEPFSNPIVIADERSQPAETEKRPEDVRRTSGQSESETRDRDLIQGSSTHAPLRESSDERGQERGRSNPVEPSASRLVATLIPSNIPAAVKTSLRLAASQLIVRDGIPSEIVAETLRRWVTTPGAGPGLLPHLCADVIRDHAAGTRGTAIDKTRAWAEFAAEERALELAETATARKELP